MIEVVGIGANVHDTLIEIPNYPKEDTKLKADSRISCGGGPCATGLVACSKLGGRAAYIGNVSDDASGDFLISDFKKYNVSTQYVTVKSGYQSFVSYVMLNKKNASRTIVFDKGNVPNLVLNDEQKSAIKDAQILMVDGNDISAAVSGARIAKQSGTKVLYDAGGLYDGIENLLPLADILIPSEEFALAVTGMDNASDAAAELYNKYRPEVVVITQGKSGGTIYDGVSVNTYGAFKVDAVDSNGAGDVFHGAFAFAVTKGFDYYKACVFSSAVSALKCTKVGARKGVPNYKTVIEFLKESGHNEFKKDLD